jgi:hypothetical protein
MMQARGDFVFCFTGVSSRVVESAALVVAVM